MSNENQQTETPETNTPRGNAEISDPDGETGGGSEEEDEETLKEKRKRRKCLFDIRLNETLILLKEYYEDKVKEVTQKAQYKFKWGGMDIEDIFTELW